MKKTKIDWCDSAWNPLSGCLHECEYCYARSIANRFGGHRTPEKEVIELSVKGESPYPYDFYPTLHKYRMNEPAAWTKSRNIFVCSMADLFGKWVPDEWINEIFKACEAAPQHNYLFLTKNPKRYIDLYSKKSFPCKDNFWFGTTVTKPTDPFMWSSNVPYKTFVSIEPILEPFGALESSRLPDWVIVGAETGKRKNKIIPKREWIEEIVAECKKNSIPLFMKSSLSEIWGEKLIQEYPEQLRKINPV